MLNQGERHVPYPLYEACINRDDKLIAELHAKTDWLAVLAKEYEEPVDRKGNDD